MAQEPKKSNLPQSALWDDGLQYRTCACNSEENPSVFTRGQYREHLMTDAEGKNPHNMRMEARKGKVSQ